MFFLQHKTNSPWCRAEALSARFFLPGVPSYAEEALNLPLHLFAGGFGEVASDAMDVVIFQPELSIGGAERVILKIAERFNPVIYTSGHREGRTFPEFKEFDIRIIRRNLLEAPVSLFAGLDKDERMRLSASAGIRFLGTKIKEDYDVLNPHMMPSEWIAARNERVCWYCHSPCRPAYGWTDFFVSERGAIGKTVMKIAVASYRLIEGRVVPKIGKICTNSEFSKKNIQKYLGRDDAEVAHPAVTLRDFECNDYQKFFFCPSRLVPEKRLEYAIEAFRRFGYKDWKLVIGGYLAPSKRNSQYLCEMRRLAAGLNVVFKLNLDKNELRSLYSDCSATLFAAKNEDWGIVPLESMASGKPCISVKEGGPRESIAEGETGFLVNSVNEMAEKMRFIADHPEICEKMGKAGRKRVEQNYTWKIFLDRMEKAFKETAQI